MSSSEGVGLHERATPEHDRLQKWFSNAFHSLNLEGISLEWEYQITGWDGKTPVRSADFVIIDNRINISNNIRAIIEVKPQNEFFSVGGTIRQLKHYEQYLKSRLLDDSHNLLLVINEINDDDANAFSQAGIGVLTEKKWNEMNYSQRSNFILFNSDFYEYMELEEKKEAERNTSVKLEAEAKRKKFELDQGRTAEKSTKKEIFDNLVPRGFRKGKE